ncbi:carbohydrate ABC transporter permease [Cohnella sp. LGH]|uniref:carbohydrate ABC transporter permease n=1 Tax=unclassified Cohnella TaxID=2636738 RepID=UPI001ADB8800|nr:carbohydrate ABC transporter permease [Cohnella sp. LGH]QTH41937.1 carbohydrate ABC transporter permease [Cohnella sp. LGH]
MRTRNRIRSILLHAAIALFSVASLYPLVIVLSGSLRPPGQSAAPLNLFEQVTMSSYRVAYETMKYPLSLWNSVLLTFVSVTAVVLLASAAAYPMARIQSRTSRFLAMFFLSGLIVSGQMALIPIYTVMDALQIKDGQLASILMFLTCSLPFSTFLYTGFINSSVPYELEEAAVIDGAGLLRRYWGIVFPLLLPATTAVIITQAVWIWNDFLYPLVFITQPDQKPLPLVMIRFLGDRENPTQWNQLFAACVLCTLPMIAAFSLLQRYFIGGMTVGAVKG